MTELQVDPALSESAILRARFGVYWRAWAWIGKQFTPTSLSAIGAVLVAAGGYIAHLRESVAQVRERVVVLETRIIPFTEGQTEIATIKAIMGDHEARIHRLEDDYDHAYVEAGTPPVRRQRGK